MYAFDLPLWTHLTPGEESLKKKVNLHYLRMPNGFENKNFSKYQQIFKNKINYLPILHFKKLESPFT